MGDFDVSAGSGHSFYDCCALFLDQSRKKFARLFSKILLHYCIVHSEA